MGKARIEIELTAKGASAVQKTLSGVLGNVRSWATGIGAALGAALSVRELVSGLKTAIDTLDKLGASAQKAGVATQVLSSLGYAASISKASLEQLEGSLKFLNRSVAEAASGTEAMVDAFARAGVELRNADGSLRATDEILLSLADSFAGMPNGAEKVRLALELLGRSGNEMIPFLNGGAEAIRALQQEARDFGVEVAPEVAQAAGDFNDNVQRLQFATAGLFQTIAAQLLPSLVALTNRMVDVARAFSQQGTLAHWVGAALKELAFWIMMAVEGFRLFGTVLDIATDWIAIFITALLRAVEVVQQTWSEMLGGVGDLVKALLGLGEVAELVFARKFVAAAERAGKVLDEVTAAQMRMMKAVGGAAVSNVEIIRDVFRDVLAYPEQAKDKLEKAVAEMSVNVLKFQWDVEHPAPPSPMLQGGSFDPGDITPDNAADLARKKAKLELEAQAQKLADERLQISTEANRIENDRWVSDTDRYRFTLSAKREELELVESYVEKLKERLALEKDDATRQLLTQQIRQGETAEANLGNDVFRIGMEGDPSSMADQMFIAMDDIARRIGTLAQQIGRAFSSIVGSAVDGIASSMSGLIRGTMDWGDALRNVAATMSNAVVNAISQMFAEWLVGRAMMALKNIMFSKAEGAADAAAKAPGAAMTSISSFGVAAVVGIAAIVAALAAFSGAFATGGPVRGPGGPTSDSVLARLSAGEYVVNAAAVKAYGEPMLDALNRRTLGLTTAPEASAGGGLSSYVPGVSDGSTGIQSRSMSLILVDSRNQARQFLESAEGEAQLVNIIRRNRMKIGVPT